MKMMTREAPLIATCIAICTIVGVAIVARDAPTPTLEESVQTESMGALNVRLVDIPKLTTRYGTFLAPRYSFVEFAAPAGIERVVVTVGDCQCVSYPAAVEGGKMSTVPVRDGVFSIALSEKSWTPYIPRTHIEDLQKKRRAVRQ